MANRNAQASKLVILSGVAFAIAFLGGQFVLADERNSPIAAPVSVAEVHAASHSPSNLASDKSGCSDCSGCSNCGPRWSLQAGLLFLQREDPDSLVLMQDTTDPARNLNANQFEFDFEAGFELSAVLERNACWSLETRLMSLNSSNAQASATTNSTLADPLRINNAPPTFVPNVQTIDADYGSDLLSVEFNLRRRLNDSWTLFGGFRFVQLDELLQTDLNAPSQLTQYDIDCDNRLYGAQVGADALLFANGRWEVRATGRAGLFGNNARHQTTLNTGVVTQTASDSASPTSFVAELAFAANYCLGPNLSLHGAYQMMWLNEVALASDQIPVTDLFNQNGINADGNVFYHGGLAGLEYIY